MFFLSLSSANVDFFGRKLQQRTYITKKAPLTTKRIKLVSKKEFAGVELDPKSEIFVIHITLLSFVTLSNFSLFNIYLFRKSQIAGIIAKKALTKILNKCINFADVFSLDLIFKLFNHTGINNYTLELVNGQQPPYRPITSLVPIELKTLKAYIGTNLANGFPMDLSDQPSLLPML